MAFNPEKPPEVSASKWLNSDTKRSLKAERGKVVVIAVAQIACPGSQKFGLPQAMRLRRAFAANELTVYGLHMPFENLDAETPDKVEAFLTENAITIPVALDKPQSGDMPATMKAYELAGTPAILIFDRQGRLRRYYLGAVDDLRIGAEVMALLIEDKTAPREFSVAVERKLAAALVDPNAHEHGDDCGCGHSHDHNHHEAHDHSHDHDAPGHVHGPGCKH